jgi:uncharacterized Zn finger protein (UPF0148 family)
VETLRNVFGKICSLCGAPRIGLLSGILVCNHCDYAVNKEGKRSTIPNRPESL